MEDVDDHVTVVDQDPRALALPLERAEILVPFQLLDDRVGDGGGLSFAPRRDDDQRIRVGAQAVDVDDGDVLPLLVLGRLGRSEGLVSGFDGSLSRRSFDTTSRTQFIPILGGKSGASFS